MQKNIKCNYTYEEFVNAMCTYPVTKRLKIILTDIFFYSFAIFFIIYGIYTDDKAIKFCGKITVFCSILITVLVLINSPKVRSKIFYNSIKKANIMYKDGAELTYDFNDESFDMTCKSTNMDSNTNVKYADLYKLATNKENIYFFINFNQCFVCKKELFTNEDIEFIKSKLSQKTLKRSVFLK